jgi:serine/threonine protein kinase
MKSMRKDFVIKNDILESLINEKIILQNSGHPFILEMIACFQQPYRVYFLMPYYRCGDLRRHHLYVQRFTETQVTFFAAQIAL